MSHVLCTIWLVVSLISGKVFKVSKGKRGTLFHKYILCIKTFSWLLCSYDNLTRHNLLESHFLFLWILQTHPRRLWACKHSSSGWLSWCQCLDVVPGDQQMFPPPLKSESRSRKWLSVNHFHQHFLEHRTPPELQIHCFSVSGKVHVIPAQYFWVPFMDLSNARSLIILIFVRIQLKMNVRYQVTVLYVLPKLWCLQRNKVSCWPWFLALDPSMK